jgi:3-oxoacyl-[acyl-carrier protein] reductase
MFDLGGKVALVTGGSRGIGRATAQVLSAQGARVFITFVGNEAAARETVEAIQAAGGTAEALRVDVADTAAAEAAVADVAKRAGRLDVLVANAGVSIDGLLLRLKDACAAARPAVAAASSAATRNILFIIVGIGPI